MLMSKAVEVRAPRTKVGLETTVTGAPDLIRPFYAFLPSCFTYTSGVVLCSIEFPIDWDSVGNGNIEDRFKMVSSRVAYTVIDNGRLHFAWSRWTLR